ncbi:MAG: thioredoxin family protein [bacterium]
MKYLKLFIFSFFVFFMSMLSAQEKKPEFYFFYATECPHCHDAYPYIKKLKKEYPQIEFIEMEVQKSMLNRIKFQKEMQRLNLKRAGVPMFVFVDNHVMGFKEGEHEEKIKSIIEEGLAKIEKNEKKNRINCEDSMVADFRRQKSGFEMQFRQCLNAGKDTGTCYSKRSSEYRNLYRSVSAALFAGLKKGASFDKNAENALNMENNVKKNWESYFSNQVKSFSDVCNISREDEYCEIMTDEFRVSLFSERIVIMLESLSFICN